jgi:glycosyltransferase involved in cell wall biosynthesis
MKNKVKVLYVANNAAFFVSHRLPIALAARNRGYSIDLVTGMAGSPSMEGLAVEKLKEANLRHQRISFSSAGLNPVTELIGLIQLIKIVNKIQPTIIHCISPKGIIYGGLAARFAKTKNLVLAISGMGFAFTQGNSSKQFRGFLSKIYSLFFNFVLKHPNVRVIVQNKDDQLSIINIGILGPDKILLIPGSGVDLEKFVHSEIEEKASIVLLPARMLWDKGVGEFIEAAKQLKSLMPEWRFILAGAADYQNPTSVPIELLEELDAKQLIEWIGHVDDMTLYFSEASIVCLPSYREGMPKCLLEAAAAGCAVVTTDAIGCRDAIIPNKSGLLVPLRDSVALKNALYFLMSNRQIRESFGRSGRDRAIDKFGLDAVIKNTISIYQEMLSHEQG